ncbi:MAG: glycosyltransferase family 39 protein [Elusimicrobiota bacterium]
MKGWLRRQEHLSPLLVILVGAGLRLAWLTSQSLWSDEALSLVVSRGEDLWGLMRRLESAPPLHFLLMRLWLRLFSDPLLGLRLFSLLCGVASLAVLYRLARAVVPEAAVFCTLIGGISSFWIHSSQDGRFYSLMLLLTLLQTAVLWKLRERDDARLWAAYVLLASLGLYTHYYMLFLVLAQAAHIAAARVLSKRSLLPALAAFAGIGILYLPWLPSLMAQAGLRRGATLVVELLDLPQLLFILGTFAADLGFLGLVLIPWLKTLGVLVLAGLVAAGICLLRQPRTAGALADWWAKGPAFCASHLVLGLAAFPLVDAFVRIPLVQPRYFIWLSPFAYMLAASACSRSSAWSKAGRYLLTAVLLGGMTGYFASNRVFNPRLDLLSRQAALLDPAAPIIHLHPFYYLPMRFHYMPGREHRLIPTHLKDSLDLANLPGYPGIQKLKDLPGMGRCIVVDPERRLHPAKAWLSTGADLARNLALIGFKEP